MKPLADFRSELQDGVLCAELQGEIDMSNAGELREHLSALTPNDALGMILDLSGVDYLDSAGIHMVYRLREGLRKRGQAFRVVVPPGSAVSDTLRLAGAEGEIATVPSAAAARESLQPQRRSETR